MLAAVFAFLSRLGSLVTEDTEHYPDLVVLRRSVTSGDWNAVSACFRELPADSDHAVAVRVVANTAGSERFLQRAVDAEGDSSLARTLLGARFIVLGWNARGRGRARDVSPAQRQVFHEYLQRAERVLADATAIDPTNAAAWTERVTLARGLGLGVPEARRRYERAAEHCAVPYVAQAQLVQYLCPKWGGSLREVHAFARECLTGSQPGTLSGAVVANAHVEHAFTLNYARDARYYLGQRDVREELAAAAAHTVLHNDFNRWHGWVDAHSVFAFALAQGYDHPSAAPHFAALGNRVTPYPWEQMSNTWKAAFRIASLQARPR
jgi:hypothetical protein